MEVTRPTGYNFTTSNTGADVSDSDVNTITGRSGFYNLLAGEQNLTVDAGLKAAASTLPATLGDRVWVDTNLNGLQDTGEVGKAGVQLQLYKVGADGLATTTARSTPKTRSSRNCSCGWTPTATAKPIPASW